MVRRRRKYPWRLRSEEFRRRELFEKMFRDHGIRYAEVPIEIAQELDAIALQRAKRERSAIYVDEAMPAAFDGTRFERGPGTTSPGTEWIHTKDHENFYREFLPDSWFPLKDGFFDADSYKGTYPSNLIRMQLLELSKQLRRAALERLTAYRTDRMLPPHETA